MKAVGVALAAFCAAVLWPSAARANPFGTREAAADTSLNVAPGWQVFDGDGDANEGVFTSQTGLDNSVHFASTGTVDAFNDERVSLSDVIDLEGLALTLKTDITLGLRSGDTDPAGDMDADGSVEHGAPPMMPHGPKISDPPGGTGGPAVSATPEPGSMLLLATGLVGLICYRRQLFA